MTEEVDLDERSVYDALKMMPGCLVQVVTETRSVKVR